jgi:septum formation protein
VNGQERPARLSSGGEGTPRGWGERLLGLDRRPLVLASASPRRTAMLRKLGIRFRARPVAVSEEIHPGEDPAQAVARLAAAKARSAARPGEDERVVGADTVVVVEEAVLGKPRDPDDARSMLERLSGREHLVMTGVAVVRGRDGALFSGVERTRVRFRALSGEDIEALVESGDGLDKAGAYGIQGLAALAVEGISGDYNNVVGLPLGLLRTLLRKEAGR